MATSHNLDEINKEFSQDVLHVYEGRRAINDLVAKICKSMMHLGMQEETCGHMQALLYESPKAHRIGELELPLCRCPIPPSLRHEEKHHGLVMMHVDSLQRHIQEEKTHLTLSKEKEGSESCMSFDSDVDPRQC